MRHVLLIGVVFLLFSVAVVLLSSGCAAIPQALPAATSVWAQTGTSVAVTPVSPAADAVAETTSSAQAALPAGRRSYTVMAGGYTFACPEDWEVQLPPTAALSLGPGHATALTAPAASYPGGNGFAIVYNSYAIAPGQSLSDWYQQVFLASQDGMIVPRGTQAVEALPITLPGVRGLLVTELMGSNPFWHRHKVYLTHDEIVLELLSETTAEHSASTVQTLRELAATVRFLPDAPRLLTDIFEHPDAPQLAEVVATATAQAVTAQTPECDLTCRDATAWATVSAGITPGPTLTYAPAMATDEARYIEMLTTATAAALTTTPTPPPSVTPVATPRPASQAGKVLYEGERLDPAGQVQTRFAVAYAPDEWALTGDYQLSTLTHRQLPHCALELQPGGWGVGGPAVSDRVSFAGLTWRTTYWIVDGWMTYWPELEGLDLWFGLRVDQQATTAEVQACRAAAEAVLRTLSFTVPSNTPDQATPGPSSVVGNWGGDKVDAPQARVELDVFSGLPNPTWRLSTIQARELMARLAALPVVQTGAFADPLGYRGFLVHLNDATSAVATIKIHSGGVRCDDDHSVTYGVDPGRQLERWLLQTIDRTQVDDEIRKMVAEQVTAENELPTLPLIPTLLPAVLPTTAPWTVPESPSQIGRIVFTAKSDSGVDIFSINRMVPICAG